ncbi:hypothetical protein GCM10028773_31540 [Spirosoma koreense]
MSIFQLQSYCNAQSRSVATFTLTHYTDENGLPQNSIKGVAPDNLGFVWLGTENGLVRFDGQHFYAFTKSNAAFATNRFYGLQPSLNDSDGIRRSIYGADEKGNFIRLQGGLVTTDTAYRATIERWSFMNTSDQPDQKNLISAGLPNYLLTFPGYKHYVIPIGRYTGCFYVCEHQRVTFYDHWKKKYSVSLTIRDFQHVFALDRNLYYRQADGSVLRISQAGATPVALTGQTEINPANGTLYWNNASSQVFLYRNKKLYQFDPRSPAELSIRLLLEDFDLEQHNIGHVYYASASNRLFLGSTTEGLFVLAARPFETLMATNKRFDNIFYAQIPYDANSVLIPNGTVLGKNLLTGKRIEKKLPAMLNNPADQSSILIDRRGNIWTKRTDKLMQFDAQGQRLMQTWPLIDAFQLFPDQTRSYMWIGGEKTGLSRIHLLDSLPRPVRFGPPKEAVYFLYENPEILLVGTRKGLYRVGVTTRKAQLIAGTQTFHIRSVYHPRPGEIWFTTYGDGFFLLLKNKLTRFPLDDNQYLATSHHIFEDNRGYFWIPTNKGLFQMAHQDLLDYALGKRTDRPFYLYYTKEHGFLTNEFNGGGQPGIVRLANGYVSIPSLHGLVWFRPESVRPALPGGPMRLDRIEENGSPMPLEGDTIRLPQEPQQIRFHLTMPYFDNINNLQLTYQLTRADASVQSGGWIRINPQEPTILLSSLASGTYRLVVRKINGFGANNYGYTRFVVTVPPLWYQTWWMRLLLVLLGVGMVYGLLRLRFRQILRENQKLEGLVTTRTANLQATLSQLKKSEQELNRQLYLQSRLMASITHDIQSPLSFLSYTARRVHQLVTAERYDNLARLTSNVASTSEHTSELLKELLTYTRAKVYQRREDAELVDLQTLVASRYDIFSNLLAQKHNRFQNEIPQGVTVRSDSHLLGIIIHNLIDNATKYTEQGQIRAYVDRADQQLHLIIANTGSGMSAQTIDWFNEQNQSESVTKLIATTQRGVGLLIVKEIAELIQIKIFVEQTENTAVHLVFAD